MGDHEPEPPAIPPVAVDTHPRVVAYVVVHAVVAGWPKGSRVDADVFTDEQVGRFLGNGAIEPIHED